MIDREWLDEQFQIIDDISGAFMLAPERSMVIRSEAVDTLWMVESGNMEIEAAVEQFVAKLTAFQAEAGSMPYQP
jgi:hypothetical protein